ncbi:hypothetical protein MTR67_041276 [Solanum verrucosum]|uniref:Reverse transcriptase zinc-binding domain-containing protein n=1 Tax=Solanum verrucosum TaxID=315347 RepID=A0AAF0UMQ8_SOLVR|nr:hypothetical protein MTR67_041276 [Solanum verrucosum]
MEGLSDMLKSAQVNNRIRGFTVNEGNSLGVSISHKQYADDTLVFCEAEKEQLKHLRVIFILFEAVSGLHINWEKSFIYPVNEVPEISTLANILGGKIGELPTTYLRMPLGAKSKSMNIWNSMVERCEKKLVNWRSQYLSLGGRVTQINSVFDAMPTYMMSLYPIHGKIIKKLDAIGRNFLWQGNGEGEKKHHLVKWESVITSKKDGGLGIKNLKAQNKSLMLKWLWRLAADDQGLWKKIIIARYGREEPWTTQAVKTPYEKGLWRTIRNQWPKMWGNSVIKVGNGRKTMFWNDIWVGQTPLRQQFPDIYNLNQQKLATISEVKNAQGWNLSFRRLLNDREVGRMIQFYNTLEQAKSLNFEEDKLLWSLDKDGKFRVKAAYKMLNISTETKEWWPWKMIWKGKIPHKVACFTWLVASQAVLTQDNLMKRGKQLCSRCFFCEAEVETVNHLFQHCKVTGKLWQWFINLRGIGWAMPRHTSEVLACWNRDGNQSEHKERWNIVPACIWWTIWKERNQRCFENKSIPFQSIKMNCLATFYFWCIHSIPKDIGEFTLFLDSL